MPDTRRTLTPGDLAPWFVARTSRNSHYRFDSVAGRYLLLCFFGSAGDALSAAVLEAFGAQAGIDDLNVSFFGVSEDPQDERQRRVSDRYPGFRHFWDFQAALRKAYGLASGEAGPGRATFVLDPALRVVACVPFGSSATDHVKAVMRILDALPRVGTVEGPGAPVLVVPAIFEPELCRRLIAYYESHGGTPFRIHEGRRRRDGRRDGECSTGAVICICRFSITRRRRNCASATRAS